MRRRLTQALSWGTYRIQLRGTHRWTSLRQTRPMHYGKGYDQTQAQAWANAKLELADAKARYPGRTLRIDGDAMEDINVDVPFKNAGVERLCDDMDTHVFVGDAFHAAADRKRLRFFMKRWERELKILDSTEGT